MQPALWVCLPSAEPVCDWLKTPAGRRPSWPGWPGGRLVSLGSLRCWWIFRQGDRISLTRVYTRHCKTPPTFSPHTLSKWLMTARHISTLSCGLFTNLSFTDHLSLLFKFFFFLALFLYPSLQGIQHELDLTRAQQCIRCYCTLLLYIFSCIVNHIFTIMTCALLEPPLCNNLATLLHALLQLLTQIAQVSVIIFPTLISPCIYFKS